MYCQKTMKVGGVLVLVGIIAVGTAANADAALMLRLTDGTTTVTVDDGGVGDSNPAVGGVTFNGSVGDWVVNTSTGVGTPVFIPGHLDLNSVNIRTSAGVGTLDIFFTETGLNPPPPGSTMNLLYGGTLSAESPASAQAFLYADDSDAAFGTTDLIGSVGPFDLSFGAFGGQSQGSIPLFYAGAYSLTQRVSLLVTGATNYSANFEVIPVPLIPEPTSLTLFGLGLAGLGVAAKRRRAKAQGEGGRPS